MILEWIEYLRTPASPLARKLGYLSEIVAIQFRRSRNKKAWDFHQTKTREQILSVAKQIKERQSVALLGAGIVDDIPIAELCGLFSEVILVDLVFSRATRKLTHRFPQLKLVEADVTGVLDSVLGTHQVPSPTKPNLPQVSSANLVISVNILSQLGIIPIRFLDRLGISNDDQEKLDRDLITAHLKWLQSIPGTSLLISDVSEGDLDLLSGVKLPEYFPLLINHWEWKLDTGQIRQVEARLIQPIHPH